MLKRMKNKKPLVAKHLKATIYLISSRNIPLGESTIRPTRAGPTSCGTFHPSTSEPLTSNTGPAPKMVCSTPLANPFWLSAVR